MLSAQGTQHLQLRSAEGTRNPWHATSLGKALASPVPEEELAALLAGDLPAPTAHTVTDPEVLRAQVARARARGWAEVDEENEVGVRSVATVVPDLDGGLRPRLAVSLGATVVLTTRTNSTATYRHCGPAWRRSPLSWGDVSGR